MIYQNSSNTPPMQSVSVGPLLIPRKTLTFFENLTNITTTGNHTLHTTSSGYRAIIPGVGICNQSGSSCDVGFLATIGGFDYPISPVTTIAPYQNITLAVGYIFEAGETLKIQLSTNVTMNVMPCIVEYLDIYPLKAPKLTAFTGSGTQDTLYTCPANTKVVLCESFFPFNPTGGSMAICNIGAGACTYNLWGVANGDSPSSTNQTIINRGIGDGFETRNVFGFNMDTAGDTLQISSSSNSAPQIAWQVLLEIGV